GVVLEELHALGLQLLDLLWRVLDAERHGGVLRGPCELRREDQEPGALAGGEHDAVRPLLLDGELQRVAIERHRSVEILRRERRDGHLALQHPCLLLNGARRRSPPGSQTYIGTRAVGQWSVGGHPGPEARALETCSAKRNRHSI